MSDLDALAWAKARIKRAMREQLASLPLAAQADVLADLRLELTEEPQRGGSDATAGSRPRKGVRRGFPIGTRVIAKAKRTTRSPSDGAGPTAAIYNYLKAHPRAPIVDLMKAGYPDDSSGNTHKARAILFSLKRQKRVKNVGHGLWEAVGD